MNMSGTIGKESSSSDENFPLEWTSDVFIEQEFTEGLPNGPPVGKLSKEAIRRRLENGHDIFEDGEDGFYAQSLKVCSLLPVDIEHWKQQTTNDELRRTFNADFQQVYGTKWEVPMLIDPHFLVDIVKYMLRLWVDKMGLYGYKKCLGYMRSIFNVKKIIVKVVQKKRAMLKTLIDEWEDNDKKVRVSLMSIKNLQTRSKKLQEFAQQYIPPPLKYTVAKEIFWQNWRVWSKNALDLRSRILMLNNRRRNLVTNLVQYEYLHARGMTMHVHVGLSNHEMREELRSVLAHTSVIMLKKDRFEVKFKQAITTVSVIKAMDTLERESVARRRYELSILGSPEDAPVSDFARDVFFPHLANKSISNEPNSRSEEVLNASIYSDPTSSVGEYLDNANANGNFQLPLDGSHGPSSQRQTVDAKEDKAFHDPLQGDLMALVDTSASPASPTVGGRDDDNRTISPARTMTPCRVRSKIDTGRCTTPKGTRQRVVNSEGRCTTPSKGQGRCTTPMSRTSHRVDGYRVDGSRSMTPSDGRCITPKGARHRVVESVGSRSNSPTRVRSRVASRAESPGSRTISPTRGQAIRTGSAHSVTLEGRVKTRFGVGKAAGRKPSISVTLDTNPQAEFELFESAMSDHRSSNGGSYSPSNGRRLSNIGLPSPSNGRRLSNGGSFSPTSASSLMYGRRSSNTSPGSPAHGRRTSNGGSYSPTNGRRTSSGRRASNGGSYSPTNGCRTSNDGSCSPTGAGGPMQDRRLSTSSAHSDSPMSCRSTSPNSMFSTPRNSFKLSVSSNNVMPSSLHSPEFEGRPSTSPDFVTPRTGQSQPQRRRDSNGSMHSNSSNHSPTFPSPSRLTMAKRRAVPALDEAILASALGHKAIPTADHTLASSPISRNNGLGRMIHGVPEHRFHVELDLQRSDGRPMTPDVAFWGPPPLKESQRGSNSSFVQGTTTRKTMQSSPEELKHTNRTTSEIFHTTESTGIRSLDHSPRSGKDLIGHSMPSAGANHRKSMSPSLLPKGSPGQISKLSQNIHIGPQRGRAAKPSKLQTTTSLNDKDLSSLAGQPSNGLGPLTRPGKSHVSVWNEAELVMQGPSLGPAEDMSGDHLGSVLSTRRLCRDPLKIPGRPPSQR